MRICEYQRLGVDISTLSISKLREVDIQTVEEEKEIARLIEEKSKGIVPTARVFIDDIKNRMDKELQSRTLTAEREKEYQSEINARIEKVKAMGRPIENPPQIPTASSVPSPATGSVADSVNLRFCEFCDSKGLRHKKDCTRKIA